MQTVMLFEPIICHEHRFHKILAHDKKLRVIDDVSWCSVCGCLKRVSKDVHGEQEIIQTPKYMQEGTY